VCQLPAAYDTLQTRCIYTVSGCEQNQVVWCWKIHSCMAWTWPNSNQVYGLRLTLFYMLTGYGRHEDDIDTVTLSPMVWHRVKKWVSLPKRKQELPRFQYYSDVGRHSLWPLHRLVRTVQVRCQVRFAKYGKIKVKYRKVSPAKLNQQSKFKLAATSYFIQSHPRQTQATQAFSSFFQDCILISQFCNAT
jgi:hypothetical protein